MSIPFEDRCNALILELGLGESGVAARVKPLTGGVSSDIALVETGSSKLCVKFALEQLKVSEEWLANVDRNRAEYLWLEFAGATVPGSSPRLYGRSDALNGFAMEFLEGDDIYLWKNVLLQEAPGRGEAARVGDVLGRIHRASAGNADVSERFQNQDDFYALRLEPYLSFTATRHPELSTLLHGLIDMLNTHEYVLVHGDVSPKNIMFNREMPVFLDAECATMGDPSFDLSFCLNHLVIKALHLPGTRPALLAGVLELWHAYRGHVSWEDPAALELRVCRLLPAMMLARVDGKSPVEYLDENERKELRSVAIPLIKDPAQSLHDFTDRVPDYVKRKTDV